MVFRIQKYKGKNFPQNDGEILDRNPSYAIESYDDFLRQVRAVSGWSEERLRDSAGGHPIYSFILGDTSKPMIVVDGCVHKSHEWRSSYWIMHLMEVLNNPLEYPALSKEINNLKTVYSFCFVPVSNPDSFVASANGEYLQGNINGVDTNRDYDYRWEDSNDINKGPYPFSQPETKNIRDIINNNDVFTYINCHSYGGYEDTGYIKGVDGKYDFMINEMNQSGRLSTHRAFPPRAVMTSTQPTSYNWASVQKNKRGNPIISYAYEVGDGILARQQSTIGVTGLLLNILHADNFFRKHDLKIS